MRNVPTQSTQRELQKTFSDIIWDPVSNPEEKRASIQKLLDTGSIDLHQTIDDLYGRTPLYQAIASKHSNTAIIQQLIAHDQSLLSQVYHGFNLLEYAVLYGDATKVTFFKGQGLRFSSKLAQAAYEGNIAALENADINTIKTHYLLHFAVAGATARNDLTLFQYLLSAIAKINQGVMQYLEAHNIHINLLLPNGASPLQLACYANQKNVVDLLVKHGANTNQAAQHGWSPLLIASCNGHTEIIRALIAARANIHQSDQNGCSPLLIASYYGHAEVIQQLIVAGAKVNQASKSGTTPLLIASHNGHAEVVRVLIAAGANIHQADHHGWSPLFAASRYGHAEVVRALIAAGANIDQADQNGTTPFWAASCCGHAEVVRVLIAARADIHQLDQNSCSPLFAASRYGHVEVVRALIIARANLNQTSKNDETPLWVASRYGHAEVVRALIAARADIHQADQNGTTPFWTASCNGHTEVVRVLIAAGANIHQVDRNGWSPLFAASRYGHAEVVRVLIVARADIHQASKGGITPLWAASCNGHTEIIRALIAARANIHQSDQNGCSPLLIASYYGHAEVVRVLIAAGANIDQTNGYETPLRIASQHGHAEVVRLILDKHQQAAKTEPRNFFFKIIGSIKKAFTKRSFDFGLLDTAIENRHAKAVKVLLTTPFYYENIALNAARLRTKLLQTRVAITESDISNEEKTGQLHELSKIAFLLWSLPVSDPIGVNWNINIEENDSEIEENENEIAESNNENETLVEMLRSGFLYYKILPPGVLNALVAFCCISGFYVDANPNLPKRAWKPMPPELWEIVFRRIICDALPFIDDGVSDQAINEAFRNFVEKCRDLMEKRDKRAAPHHDASITSGNAQATTVQALVANSVLVTARDGLSPEAEAAAASNETLEVNVSLRSFRTG